MMKCTYLPSAHERMLGAGQVRLPSHQEPPMTRTRILVLGAAGLAALVFALACGGGANTLATPPVTSGSVGFITTDSTTETWSNVSVIIRKASLVLKSDQAAAHPVQIYDGSKDATAVNLLQEDQVEDLLGQVSGVPAGTYNRLIVEVDGAPSTITLVPAVSASALLTPAAVSTTQIVVTGTPDPAANGWLVLPTIALSSDLTVAAGQTSAVAVDFNLAHPAFIVEHDVTTATGDAQTLYVVDFGVKGVFTHKAAATLDKHYLRRHLGTVKAVAADGSSLTLTTEHGQDLVIEPDPGANPTLFYNLDVALGAGPGHQPRARRAHPGPRGGMHLPLPGGWHPHRRAGLVHRPRRRPSLLDA